MATVGVAEYDVQISRAKVAAEVNAAGQQIERGLGQSAEKVKSSLGGAIAAGAGLAIGGRVVNDAIQAASNLAEQQAKVGQVFGDSATQVQTFAENAATAIGQSERSALEAAGTFGNLFRSVGIAGDDAAELSITLTTLASDLASFNNVSVDDALTALRSGLVGETEPLKRFGVNLNEATLKAKALELGLSDGKAVLDASAKAQAAYALILEQTTLAQGDFERTSDSLANKQRTLSAEFENTKAELGEGLIPAAQGAVDVLSAMARVLEVIPRPVLAVAGAAGVTVAAVKILGPVFSATAAAMRATGAAALDLAAKVIVPTAAIDGLGTSSARTAASQRALAGSMLSSGAAAAGIGIAVLGISKILADQAAETARAEQALADYEDEVSRFEATIRASGPEGALDQIIPDFAAENEGILDRLGVDAATLKAELDKGAASFQQFIYDLNYSGTAQLTGEDGAALSRLALRYDEARARAEEYQRAKDELTNSTDRSTRALDAESQEYADLRDQIQDTFDAERDVADATRNTLEAADQLNQARRAATGDSDEYRRAQEAIADAQDGVADSAKAVADAERNLADAQRQVQVAQESLTQARRDAAESLEDLRFAAEGAALAEERAVLRLEDARERLNDVRNDPRSTDRDRREAELGIREAELALAQARDQNEDSALALADAEAKGVEGSDAVVAAKQAIADALRNQQDAADRVRDALDAQREAEKRVADATKAAAKVLDDAKGRVEEASRELEDAILDEAEAQQELNSLTGDAADGTEAYIDVLDRWRDQLDPSSPFRQNLSSYIDDLRELNELATPGYGDAADERDLDRLGNLNPNRVPNAVGNTGPVLGGPGTSGSTGGAVGGTYTINVTTNANPQEIANAIMW